MIFNKLYEASLFNVVSMLEVRKAMKRILVREELCFACGLCEVYCIVQYSRSRPVWKRTLNRIRIEVDKPISFAVQCHHCEYPLCVDAYLSALYNWTKKPD